MSKHLQTLIDKINESSQSAYGEDRIHHLSFLKECNDYLFDYFKEKYKIVFNFSALSYRNMEDEIPFDFIKGYDFCEENINGVETLKLLFKNFIQEAKDKKTINLTYVLTTQIDTQEVFLAYSQKTPDRLLHEAISLGDVIYFDNLTEFMRGNYSIIKSFCERLNGDISEIDKYARYIWNYKKIFDCYTKYNPNRPFYLYFIRPSSLVSDYRILLSLSTSSPLSEEDLGMINFILYRIVSQTAIEKYKDKLAMQTKANDLEIAIGEQKKRTTYVELNTYHHLGSNLKELPNLLNVENFNAEQNLNPMQLLIIKKVNAYITSLLSNSQNMLKAFKEHAVRMDGKGEEERYAISLFFAEMEGLFQTYQINDSRLALKWGEVIMPSQKTFLSTHPNMIRHIIEGQISNMNAEFEKPLYSQLASGLITLNIAFLGDIKRLVIKLENDFSALSPEIIQKAGIEPINSPDSSGLGFYFLNSLLSWSNALKPENRYFELQNIDIGTGMFLKFQFRTTE